MSEVTNKSISARYYEAWNRRNLSIPDQIFDSSFFIHDPASPVPLQQGPQGIKDRIQLYHTAFPDLQIVVQGVWSDADIVVTRWTLKGTHLGMFSGHAPTHKEISVTGITLHRIVDQRIVEAWVNWDTLTLWQQLGLIYFNKRSGPE